MRFEELKKLPIGTILVYDAGDGLKDTYLIEVKISETETLTLNSTRDNEKEKYLWESVQSGVILNIKDECCSCLNVAPKWIQKLFEVKNEH